MLRGWWAMGDLIVPDDIARLLRAARAVIPHSYAPYSGFPVGATILTVSGEVFAGCNMENAAYPLGLCAEAVALGAMVSAIGAQRLRAALVLTARPVPSWPCGGVSSAFARIHGGGCHSVCRGLRGRASWYPVRATSAIGLWRRRSHASVPLSRRLS